MLTEKERNEAIKKCIACLPKPCRTIFDLSRELETKLLESSLATNRSNEMNDMSRDFYTDEALERLPLRFKNAKLI